MQRGILELTREELFEVFKYFDLEGQKGKPLETKLSVANSSEEPSVTIELSEDEVELILDSVAIPTGEDNDHTASLRTKAQGLLSQFRAN